MTQRNSKNHKKRIWIGISILVMSLFITAALYVYQIRSSSPRVLPETAKNSQKKIPPDVKKELDRQMQTASVSATYHVPILMYHYVEYIKDKKDKERQLLNVTPPVFEMQIQTLLQAGYTIITAKELGDILDGKMAMPNKPVMLTFDDGHWDLDTYVLPILKKYQVKVTAYIVPGFVGTNSDSLTQKQLQEVVDSGLVDVGAHTVHHISLKGKSLSKAQYEIDESKTMLEQQYHIHVYSFAYPYGSFDLQSLKLVKQAGFTTAASTIAGNEQNQQNRFFLFRVRPGYMTGKGLLNYLNAKWKPYTFNSTVQSKEASSAAIIKSE